MNDDNNNGANRGFNISSNFSRIIHNDNDIINLKKELNGKLEKLEKN